MNSLQLQLSSSNVDSKNDNSFIFYIPTGSILAESQEHIYISVQSAIIPNTFYNINSYNNILCYALVSNNIKQYLTIPVGNYNIKDIVSYLNSYMTNFTISYNKTYNKLTFQNLSLANFIIYPESTLYGHWKTVSAPKVLKKRSKSAPYGTSSKCWVILSFFARSLLDHSWISLIIIINYLIY